MLEGAQPADMAIVKKKLAKFKPELLKSLAAPEEAPEGEDLINLFEDSPYAHGKRPLKSDYAAVSQKRSRIADEKAKLVE